MDYEEQISRYSNKLAIASQQLEQVRVNLKEMETLADDGWKSIAGEAAVSKIEELNYEISVANNSLNAAMNHLYF